jgi:hypothetical protein
MQSGKQHRFMETVAHDADFAKKAGVPQSVGKDFADADKGKTFKDKKRSPLYTHPKSKGK